MKTAQTGKRINVNGAILTDELLDKIINIEECEIAEEYCEKLNLMKDFFIKCLDKDSERTLNQSDLIDILPFIVYIHDFISLFIIKVEEDEL